MKLFYEHVTMTMEVKRYLVNTETFCLCTFSILKIYGWILCSF